MAKAGIVQNITGNVVAKSIDGSVRTLFPGDEILLNEVIETSDGAGVSIILNDGNTIVLGGNETMVFDDTTAGLVDGQDAVVDDVAELQRALSDGENIDDLQQETAAGFEDSPFIYNEEYLQGDNSRGDESQSDSSELIDVDPESDNAGFDSLNKNDDRSDLGIDTVEGTEDQVLVIDVTANDNLADGSVLSAVTNGTNGSVAIVDGKILYTPDKDFEGEDSFTYTVSDEDGSTSTTSVNVVINDEGNPTAVDDNAAMVEDQSILLDVTANDSMIDGAVLSGVTNGANGTAEIVDGRVRYTPNKDFEGEDSFTYTITDEDGVSSTSTMRIRVDDEGTPTAVGDESRVTEEQSVVIDVTANDSMVDGSALTNVTNGANGTVEIIDGKAKYTPNKDFEGEDEFTYTITDEDGSVSRNTVKVIVDDEGNPTASSDSADAIAGKEIEIDVTANDSMIDGAYLSSVDTPSHGTIEIKDGKLFYTPDANFAGKDSFTYTITDEDGVSSSGNVSVNISDKDATKPVVDVNTSAAGKEDQWIELDIKAELTDLDGSENLKVVVKVPDGASLNHGTDNEDGTWTLKKEDLSGLTIKPPHNSSEDMTLKVDISSVEKDGGAESEKISHTIKVQVAPAAGDVEIKGDDVSGNEDTAIKLNFSADVTDSDETITEVRIEGIPEGASLSAGTENKDGSWTIDKSELSGIKITPPEDSDKDFDLTIKVTTQETDGGIVDTETISHKVHVDVKGVADTPVISFETGNDANVVEDGLVGHWTFDEGSGNKTFNQAGNNHGTLKYGAQFDSTGHNGSSILLDKEHAFVDVKDGGFSNQLSKTATMSAWIKIPDEFTGNDTGWNSPSIAGSEQVGGVSDVQWGWLDKEGHINISVGNVQGAKSSTAVNDGKWHHVVMSRDASTGETKIYIDGDLKGFSNEGPLGVKKSHIDGFGKTNANDGKETSDIDKFFKGELDDIRVYNRVLSDDEVKEINTHESAPQTSELTGVEGEEISFAINAASSDIDNSETLTIEISGVPDGAVLSDGKHFGHANTVDVSGWDLKNLSIKFPENSIKEDKKFTLKATATASEDGTKAESSAEINIKVTNDTQPEAVADENQLERFLGIPKALEGNVLENDVIKGGIGTPGVDSAVLLTSVVYAGTSYSFGENDSITINSGLGKITFDKQGNYTYKDKVDFSSWEKQEFTYTIEDGDGDKSSNVLTIYNSRADRDSDAADDASRSFAPQSESDVIDSSDDSSDLKDDNSFGTDNDDVIGAHEGSDEIHAGAGDDSIVFDSDDTIVDGGTGFDSLLINNSSLDFSNVKTDIQNIEKLDLNSSEKQVVNLTLNDVMDMTDSNNTLEIAGGEGDSVEIDTTGWESKGDGIFSNGTDTVHISSFDDDSNHVNIHYTDDGTEIS